MNQDASTQLLSQLKDIHGAPEAPFWPPAPGWWVLACLLLLLLAWFAVRGLRAWRLRRHRRVLQDRLAGLRQVHDPASEPQAWLAAVNRLLKAVALRARPGAGAERLSGAEWAAWLGGDESPEAFTALAAGPWQACPEFDADAVEHAALDWIRRHG